jgi:chromosome segregation ATPase
VAKAASQAQELEDYRTAKAHVVARIKRLDQVAEKNLQEAEERAKRAADQAEQDMNALRSELQSVKSELAAQEDFRARIEEAEVRAKTSKDAAEAIVELLKKVSAENRVAAKTAADEIAYLRRELDFAKKRMAELTEKADNEAKSSRLVGRVVSTSQVRNLARSQSLR